MKLRFVKFNLLSWLWLRANEYLVPIIKLLGNYHYK